MTKLRDHAIFHIEFTVDHKARIEDETGDLVGYGSSTRQPREVRIVAPSEGIARSWVADRYFNAHPHIERVTTFKLDGFVQDHIW